MSEVNEFLKDLNGTDDVVDTDIVEDIADEPKDTDTKKDGDEVKDDTKVLPFHKDPKVQKFIQKQIEKGLEEKRGSATEDFKKEVGQNADEIDEVLIQMIGNDTPEKLMVIKNFKRVLLDREDKGAEKALKFFQNQQEEQQRLYKETEDEFDQGFDSIEDTYNVDISSNTPAAKKMRRDFIDFIGKVAPKNNDGEMLSLPDMVQTFSIFQEVNKKTSPTTSKAKEISSRSIARSGDSTNVAATGGRSWKDVDRLFAKMRQS